MTKVVGNQLGSSAIHYTKMVIHWETSGNYGQKVFILVTFKEKHLTAPGRGFLLTSLLCFQNHNQLFPPLKKCKSEGTLQRIVGTVVLGLSP